jgi:hypothetical protein
MRSFSWLLLSMIAAACAPQKADDKGVVDDSEPPAIPSETGKTDEASRIVPVLVESDHPYTDNLDRIHRVDLGVLPGCATDARLHFSVLRTEANYDHVTVEPVGDVAQSFDGDRDGTWTAWFAINADHVDVRLDTDSSITRHGFVIDQIEWDGQPVGCDAPHAPCAAGLVDTAPRPGACECPIEPACAPLTEIAVGHFLARGNNRTAKQFAGAVASTVHPGLHDEAVTTIVGTVDLVRVHDLISRAAASGALHGPGYARPIDPAGFREELAITAGTYTVSFVATQGEHDPDVAALIGTFESLFTCGGIVSGLTCGDGFECGDDASCVEDAGCACPAHYDPQCGIDGRTYSNGCAAGCADMTIAHPGECGQVGDMCGGMQGLPCLDDNRCRYDASTFDAPFPDAAGSCVARDYCDAPADCNALPHPAVPGAWGCDTNTCAWHAGPQWRPVTNGRFETAHPYANSTSVWKELYLPAEAQALRLLPTGSFRLETGYDYLEVWTWQTGAWRRIKRYTGTTAPAVEELPGRFHYLHFVSDSSVTDTGFVVDAEWR